MKKICKVSFIITFLACILVTFSSVYASTPYPSSLDIRENNSFYGSDYDCVEGDYSITINPTSFKWYGHCNLTVDLYRNDWVGKTFLHGYAQDMTNTDYDYNYYMGYYKKNSIKYYFEAKSGGVFADYGRVLIYGH